MNPELLEVIRRLERAATQIEAALQRVTALESDVKSLAKRVDGHDRKLAGIAAVVALAAFLVPLVLSWLR